MTDEQINDGYSMTAIGGPFSGDGSFLVLPKDFDKNYVKNGQHGHKESLRRSAWQCYRQPNLLYKTIILARKAYIVGERPTFEPLNYDPEAQAILAEWWARNEISSLIRDMHIMLENDGEAGIFYARKDRGDNPYVFAMSGKEIKEIHGAPALGPSQIDINGGEKTLKFKKGRFVWYGHETHRKEFRGWPVLAGVPDACNAYVDLLQARSKLHKLQNVITLVLTHLIDMNQKRRKDKDIRRDISDARKKSVAFDGTNNMVHLNRDKDSGHAGAIDTITPGKGAEDASLDAKAIRRLALSPSGIQDYQAGYGDDINRATAEVMSQSSSRFLKESQGVIVDLITKAARIELRRELTGRRDYLITSQRDSKKGPVPLENRTPINQWTVDLRLPSLWSDNLEEQIKKFEFACKFSGIDPKEILRNLEVPLKATGEVELRPESGSNANTRTIPDE